MSTPATALSQGAGYGVVLGVGFFFTALMACISFIQNRYTRFSLKSTEEFNTASRSVKPGLIAAAIVSAWTWAATLLQSTTVGYQFGIAGPFWYAAGATNQILLFAMLAVKVKQNAPGCHTYLEVINVRYGRTAHIVFLGFALATNLLVASQLLLGGSAVVNSLTGMNVYAAVILTPIGVAAYVILGGLRATFLCDYSHTFILWVCTLYFVFKVYATSPKIGSPTEMWHLLNEASKTRPVVGNKDGSYLTMKSDLALIFGVIQICSGAGNVFLDQGYWQRAIASEASGAVKGYLLGGLAWFAIPFAFATTLGLAAVALTTDPAFPTYPNPLTSSQASAGLAAPAAAVALAGKGGAAALLITLFMACTSCLSAELIATSSILTFDIYKTYWKKSATQHELINVSHAMICVMAVITAGIACLWQGIGINLGWLFYTMGLLVGGAVFPVSFAIIWRKQTAFAATVGALSGLFSGIFCWLLVAGLYYREISIETTGASYPALAGNMGAVFTGGIVSVALTLIKPDNTFNWESTRALNNTDHFIPGVPPKPGSEKGTATLDDKDENESGEEKIVDEKNFKTGDVVVESVGDSAYNLTKAFRFATISSVTLTFIMLILFPLPMFGSGYIFSVKFFTGWIVISIIWAFLSAFVTCLLPLWESKGALKFIGSQIFNDILGRRREPME